MSAKTPSAMVVELETAQEDIAKARCGSRCQCVIARCIDRIYGLGGKGHVSVDANEIAFTDNGYRHHFHPDRRAVELLRRFDLAGETAGLKAARKMIQPGTFEMTYLKSYRVSPNLGNNSRKAARTPAASQKMAAMRAARTRSVAKRYVGV